MGADEETTPEKTGLALLDLHYDLKSLIISYVTRPTDLKNLCLTCKPLRDVAVRQLYRRVELEIGGEADLKLSALLSRSNPGLEHIRTLVLNPDPSVFPSSSQQSPQQQPQQPVPPAPQIQGLATPPLVVMHALQQAPPPAPPPPPPLVGGGGVGIGFGAGAALNQQNRNRNREERKRRWSPAHFTVRLLIDFLPEHILEKFRWTSYEDFSVDNFVLLCKKQKNLRSLEVGPTDSSLMQALDRNPNLIKNLKRLHSLDLYPNNLDCLQACHRIILDTPALDELWIEAGFDHSSPGDGSDDTWDDLSNKPGITTSTLFRHLRPFQSCSTPMRLKFLALYKLNIRWIAQTYMRVIDFPHLTELEVRSCAGADAIFAEMAKPAKRPTRLEDLTFVHAGDDRNPQYVQSALDNFLSAVSTLRKLCVVYGDANTLPKMDGVCNQAAGLRLLIVHSYDSNVLGQERVYSKDDFARLCRECTHLQQLIIACPPLKALESGLSESFKSYLDCVLTLPELVTFSVTQWPDFSYRGPDFGMLGGLVGATAGQDNTVPRDVYEHQVQRLAQLIFQRKETLLAREARDSAMSAASVTASSSTPSGDGGSGGDGGNATDAGGEGSSDTTATTTTTTATSTSTSTNPFATTAATTRKRPINRKLRVVAFGCNAKSYSVGGVNEHVHQLIYVPGEQLDPFGQRVMCAVAVKPAALKFIEPNADMLEYRFPEMNHN